MMEDQDKPFTAADRSAETALHYAAWNGAAASGRAEVVACLFSVGPHQDLRERHTPSDTAALGGQPR